MAREVASPRQRNDLFSCARNVRSPEERGAGEEILLVNNPRILGESVRHIELVGGIHPVEAVVAGLVVAMSPEFGNHRRRILFQVMIGVDRIRIQAEEERPAAHERLEVPAVRRGHAATQLAQQLALPARSFEEWPASVWLACIRVALQSRQRESFGQESPFEARNGTMVRIIAKRINEES